MTRQQLLDKPDFFNLVHGITLRAIQTFADNELHHREGPEDTGATDEERCVRTVSHDPEMLVKHHRLLGHSEEYRCCGKSLTESALVGVGVRY